MRDPARATGGRWPELDWHAWKDTATTSHMWMQIVGKTRFVLTPLQNHWWNVPLYVSARGLATSAVPWRGGVPEVEFRFPGACVASSDEFGGDGGVSAESIVCCRFLCGVCRGAEVVGLGQLCRP